MSKSESSGGQSSPAQARPTAETEKILIKTADMQLEVDQPDAVRRQALALVAREGGRPGNETKSGSGDYEQLTLTLHVPAARFVALMDGLSALGKVLSRSTQVEDLTEEFVDNGARLRSLNALEARYLALLNEAKTVKDMLAVEEKLGDVRSRNEQLTGRQRYLSQNARESRITLTLSHQSTQSTGFLAKLAKSLTGGWDLLLSLILGVAYLWPIAIGVGLIGLLVRTLRNRRQGPVGK